MTQSKYITCIWLCLLFYIVGNPVLASQTLDSVEFSVVTWSEAHVEEAVDLLEKLVNINSGTHNASE